MTGNAPATGLRRAHRSHLTVALRVVTDRMLVRRMCAALTGAVRSLPDLDCNARGQGRAVSGVSERERRR